jgi:hypothetical protein
MNSGAEVRTGDLNEKELIDLRMGYWEDQVLGVMEQFVKAETEKERIELEKYYRYCEGRLAGLQEALRILSGQYPEEVFD